MEMRIFRNDESNVQITHAQNGFLVSLEVIEVTKTDEEDFDNNWTTHRRICNDFVELTEVLRKHYELPSGNDGMRW